MQHRLPAPAGCIKQQGEKTRLLGTTSTLILRLQEMPCKREHG